MEAGLFTAVSVVSDGLPGLDALTVVTALLELSDVCALFDSEVFD